MLQGTGVALVTPFKGEKVDYDALGQLIDTLIQGEVDYIVALGTTGEAATLTNEEKSKVLIFCREAINKRVPLLAGIGSNDTAYVQDELRTFDIKGIDGILSVCPYYNKPTQEGIFRHYIALTEMTDLPFVIYNVPGRTGVNMSPETTVRLANYSSQFIGIKEASGDLEQVAKLIRDKPANFQVVSGNDELVLPYLANGADGIISVIANGYPKLFSDIVRFGLANKYPEARLKNAQLIDVIDLLFKEGNPVGIKGLLSLKYKFFENSVRLPLVPATQDLLHKLTIAMNKVKL